MAFVLKGDGHIHKVFLVNANMVTSERKDKLQKAIYDSYNQTLEDFEPIFCRNIQQLETAINNANGIDDEVL